MFNLSMDQMQARVSGESLHVALLETVFMGEMDLFFKLQIIALFWWRRHLKTLCYQLGWSVTALMVQERQGEERVFFRDIVY